jgi:hypothetical protein
VADSTEHQASSIPPEIEGENIPLLFNVPIGLNSRYAQHLLVQTTENEAILSFFEVVPPVVTGTLDEIKQKLKEGVRADCVARITISRARYPEFVKAMVGQLTPEEQKDLESKP